MRKRSIIISILCSLALPSGALAESNQEQNPQSIKVENRNQLLSAVDSTSISALTDDSFGPVLESATVSPTTVTVGETITITAIVSDESGVSAVDAYLNLPDARGYKVVPLELDSATGEWKGTYTITDLDIDGTWIINFDLFDNAGNYSFGDDRDDTVQVVNPNGGDSEFPTLESATLSSSAVGINEEFTITAKVNDNNGVDTVYAAVYTADSTGYYYLPLTLDETTGDWVLSHIFTEGDRSGTWYIDLQMFDTAGNFDWVALDNQLVLTNPFSDFTAPSIGEPVFSTTSASPGESIKVSVPVSDAQSDVSSVYAEFSHIDDPNNFYLQHLTLDPASGEWVGDIEIGSGFQSGIWNVIIHSTDSVGNSGFKEVFGAFDVINNDGDFEKPVISNIQVTQGEVQVGGSVTVTASVTDNVAVDSVLATLYGQEGSNEYITLSYDEVNQLWTGSFVVQETTAPGFYQASISTYDTSFNLSFADAQGGFTVINPDGDHTGPVVSDVVFDKTEVNAGEQITIAATVEDAGSGVASVTANYYENETIDLKYDSNQDKWVGTITIPMNVPDGEVVNINFIDAADQSGNQTVQFIDGVSFQVHNPDGDFIAPVVESFAMTPPTVNPGETVHFETKLVDDKSGIKSATVYLYNESDPNIPAIDLTYDEASGVWTADYVIPATTALGTYSVGMGIEDNAGNVADYLADQTLLVEEKPADTTPPVVPVVEAINDQTTVVSGSTEGDADVTVLVGTTEIGSGKADGEGKFSITIAPQAAGTTISITAKDAAGNASSTDVTVIDTTAPVAPTVGAINDKTTVVSGTTEANADVTVLVGTTEIGSGKADGEGKFSITIAPQAAGTAISVTAKDAAGNASSTTVSVSASFTEIGVQLNGKDFTTGYFGAGTTHVHVKALDTFKIPYTVKENGILEIEGRTVQAEVISGELYIRWNLLSPGKVTYKKTTNGFNFIYAVPTTVKLNGASFPDGYFKNGTTYLHWSSLNTFKIPFTYNGDGSYTIEGRTVKGESINGALYIEWSLLSPGKVTFTGIPNGYNFIYAVPTKVQLNGADFLDGYFRNGTTYVHWSSLKQLNIPFTYNGNVSYTIEGRNVQAVSINGALYIEWSLLSPGKVTFKGIPGGFNFIYAAQN